MVNLTSLEPCLDSQAHNTFFWDAELRLMEKYM